MTNNIMVKEAIPHMQYQLHVAYNAIHLYGTYMYMNQGVRKV